MKPPKHSAKSVRFRVTLPLPHATDIRNVQLCDTVSFISITFTLIWKLSNQVSRILNTELHRHWLTKRKRMGVIIETLVSKEKKGALKQCMVLLFSCWKVLVPKPTACKTPPKAFYLEEEEREGKKGKKKIYSLSVESLLCRKFSFILCVHAQFLSHVWVFAIPYPPVCPWDSPGKHTGVGCLFLL